MRFGDPQYLWLLALLPLLAAAGVLARARARRATERFAGGREWVSRFTEQVSRDRRAVKTLLLFFALALLVVALGRPQWGARTESVTRRGLDIAIALDVSLSMASPDLPPSRLAQAVSAVEGLLERTEGDRAALVTFAWRPAIACPLTSDHGALRLFLESVELAPGAEQGTGLAAALGVAASALRSPGGASSERDRVIVLLTDGEDHEGGLDAVIERLAREGIAVYVVGVGTGRGTPIPLADEAGRDLGYKKDREERVVTSRLAEDALERVALETGGRYYRATTGGVEIGELARALDALHRGEYGAELRTRYEDRFQWPLAIGVLALAVETALSDRRRARRGEAGEAR